MTVALVLLPAAPARAEPPDPWVNFVAGAVPAFAGFAVGGVLLGTSRDHASQNNAGWLTLQGGFVLAPLAAHAVADEWARGAVFASPAAAAFAGTIALMEYAPKVVGHGTLEQQRVLWGLLGIGLFSSAIAIVDSAFARDRFRERAIHVTPTASFDGAGLAIEGSL
jgi:hypothetical protein